jgi:AcrR family transcriptional regulator
MAKPKSEDKRNAILSAASQVFAERGLSAPTVAITSAAGIAKARCLPTSKRRLVRRNRG